MPNKIIRDLYTGELKEVPFEGSGTIARISPPGGTGRRTSGAGWPMISWSAATDPRNVKSEQEILKQHGVTTEYTPTGEPIFLSRSHRKRHCEALGLYDRNGGSGDPQPKNFNASDYGPGARERALEQLLSQYE